MKIIFLLAGLLFLTDSAFADTVYLKRGEVVEVSRAWEQDGLVYVQLEDGAVHSIEKGAVLRIQKQTDVVADQAVLQIDTGRHKGVINGIFFIRGGRFVVSCSHDKSIRVWDVGSGELVKTIRVKAGYGEDGKILSAAMSPDDQHLAIGGWFGRSRNRNKFLPRTGGEFLGNIRIVDLASGEITSVLKGNRYAVVSLQYSRNGRKLISSTYGDPPAVWDAYIGQKVRVFKTVKIKVGPVSIAKAKTYGLSAALSPDGLRVIAGGNLWDAQSGRFIAYLKDAERDKWHREKNLINDNYFRFLPEYEKKFYKDPNTGWLYDQYWESYNGQWSFTPDGQFILSKNSRDDILLWNGRNGRLIQRIDKPADDHNVDELLISPDGKTIMTSGWNGSFRMNSVRHLYRIDGKGQTLLLLKAFDHLPRGVSAMSPDGRLAAIGCRRDENIYLWDIQNGRVIKKLGTEPQSEELLFANADESTYDVQATDGYADLSQQRSIAQLRRAAVAEAKHKALIAAQKRVHALFDKDAKSRSREIIFRGGGNEIRTLDFKDFGIENNSRYHVRLKTRIKYRTLPREAADNLRSGKIWGVGFSRDGRFVGWGKKAQRTSVHNDVALDQSFQLFDENLDPKLMLGSPLKGAQGWIRSLETVGDVTIRTESNRIQVRTGEGTYQNRSSKIRNVYSYSLTPNGRLIIGGGDDGVILAHRVDTNALIYEFIGHSGNVWGLAVSPDGKLLVSGSDDRTVRLWPLNGPQGQVKPILSFFHGTDNEWIAWTPDGYYTSSINGDRYIGWQFNNGKDRSADFYSAFQFERLLYRPDIVHSRLSAATGGVANQELKSPSDAGVDRLKSILPPKIRIITPEFGDTVKNAGTAALQFSVEKNSIDMLEYSVFVNGIPVTGFDERFLKGADRQKFERGIKLPLFGKKNRIRIEVFNGKSLGVAHTLLYRSKAYSLKAPGDLYILSVGINSFARMPQFNLNYAAQDAESIAAVFSNMEGRNFKRVHAKILSDRSKVKPTKDNILQALAFLRLARANDTVIVFIASHGFSDSAGNYYFVPSDASFVEKRQQNLSGSTRGVMLGPANFSAFISWEDFFEAMKSAAGKRLLIVDTCQAQKVSGTLDIHSLAKRSYSSSFALLVAAKGNELSQEYPPGEHGLFTYALLNGIAGDADNDGDNQLTLEELYRFTASFVERKRDSKLGPQTPLMVSPHDLSEMVLASF